MKHIFKFICCGNVDDGKSTLIGRILLDTNNVKKDQIEDAKKASLKNGSDTIELAMLLDGLLSEREQQITIDIAHRYFDYKNIRFHILDCPGHKQYTKNMAIAAAEVDTAIVVIDVNKGIQEQTKKHIQICSQFKLKNICICLTKCDLIFNTKKEPSSKRIKELYKQIEELMSSYDFEYKIIPVSAVSGYNIDKVLEQICLYAKKSTKEKSKRKEIIIHIQAAKLYKGKRYYYGREVSNISPAIGKKYNLLPDNIPVTITSNPVHGCFQIKENVDISAGDCIANCPVIISNFIKHKTIWFDKPTKNMLLKHGSRTVKVIKYTDEIIELDSKLLFNNIEDIKQNGFGIFIDNITKKTLGCCIFSQNNKTVSQKKIKGEIYFVPAKNLQDSRKKITAIMKKFNVQPIILNCLELQDIIQKSFNLKDVYLLAETFAEQSFNIIVAAKKEDIKIYKQNLSAAKKIKFYSSANSSEKFADAK